MDKPRGAAAETDAQPEVTPETKVGEIMTELSDNVTPNPSFRFHT